MGSRADALEARDVMRRSREPGSGRSPDDRPHDSYEGSFEGSLGLPSAYVGWAIGVLIAVIVMLTIGRVVLDAANAAARVQELRTTNAELRARVDALAAERQLVTSPIFVQVAGRGRGYGAPDERAFGLVAGGPPPPVLAAETAPADDPPSPLDAWLTLLLGR